MKVEVKNIISQKQAALLRGTSQAAISELVKRGRLKTVTIGGHEFLLKSEVLRFENQKPGPKPRRFRRR